MRRRLRPENNHLAERHEINCCAQKKIQGVLLSDKGTYIISIDKRVLQGKKDKAGRQAPRHPEMETRLMMSRFQAIRPENIHVSKIV